MVTNNLLIISINKNEYTRIFYLNIKNINTSINKRDHFTFNNIHKHTMYRNRNVIIIKRSMGNGVMSVLNNQYYTKDNIKINNTNFDVNKYYYSTFNRAYKSTILYNHTSVIILKRYTGEEKIAKVVAEAGKAVSKALSENSNVLSSQTHNINQNVNSRSNITNTSRQSPSSSPEQSPKSSPESQRYNGNKQPTLNTRSQVVQPVQPMLQKFEQARPDLVTKKVVKTETVYENDVPISHQTTTTTITYSQNTNSIQESTISTSLNQLEIFTTNTINNSDLKVMADKLDSVDKKVEKILEENKNEQSERDKKQEEKDKKQEEKDKKQEEKDRFNRNDSTNQNIIIAAASIGAGPLVYDMVDNPKNYVNTYEKEQNPFSHIKDKNESPQEVSNEININDKQNITNFFNEETKNKIIEIKKIPTKNKNEKTN